MVKFFIMNPEIFLAYLPYFFLAFLIVDIVFFVWIFFLWKKMRTIFRGESGNLDEVLVELRKNQDLASAIFKEIKSRVKNLEEEIPKDIRRTGLVRYNPFSDAGGDHSFALALLNDHKDGIVVSSLYGREINRIYAKSVEKGVSKYPLTEEEKQAIENAK